jgi:Trk K+ transport system NAD-binding subunit
VAATSNELVNLELGLLARELNPAQRVVVRLTDPQLAQTLRQSANIRLAVSVPDLAAPAFVAALFGDRVRGIFLAEGRLLAAVDVVLHSPGDAWDGQPLAAVARDFHLLPVALTRDGAPGPLPECLRNGDRVTVLVGLAELQRLLHREKVPVASEPRPSGSGQALPAP